MQRSWEFGKWKVVGLEECKEIGKEEVMKKYKHKNENLGKCKLM